MKQHFMLRLIAVLAAVAIILLGILIAYRCASSVQKALGCALMLSGAGCLLVTSRIEFAKTQP